MKMFFLHQHKMVYNFVNETNIEIYMRKHFSWFCGLNVLDQCNTSGTQMMYQYKL